MRVESNEKGQIVTLMFSRALSFYAEIIVVVSHEIDDYNFSQISSKLINQTSICDPF